MLFRTAALLGAAGVAVLAAPGVPTLEDRGLAPSPDNSSIETLPKGFEVVIVYAQPSQGCPATPSECSNPFGPPSLGEGPPKPKPKPTPAFTHNGPTETLPPSIHWGCDTRPAKNVIPVPVGKGSQLYYGVSGELDSCVG